MLENNPNSRPNDGYNVFSKSIRNRFNEAVKNGAKLFRVNVDNLFETFLNGLGEDKQHYNCNCCSRFINRYGGLVVIDNGKLKSVLWDFEAPEYFNNSVKELKSIVENASIKEMFISDDAVLGTPETCEWKHIHIKLPISYVNMSQLKTAGQLKAEKREEFRMLNEALQRFSTENIKKAVELLKSETLYRSEQYMKASEWFLELKKKAKKEIAVWNAIAIAPAGFAHISGSMVGSLLRDLSDGLNISDIKARWETKVNPERYMRAQVAPKKGNIQRAEGIVEKLGIKNSLVRQYAKLKAIPKIWETKDISEKKESKTGIFGNIQAKQEQKANNDMLPEKTMTWSKFIRTILNTANTIEAKTDNNNRFAAIVRQSDKEADNILKWDNLFSWYYHGGADANIKKRIEAAGAQYDNCEIACRLVWDNTDDLDIHCITPSGENIGFEHKKGRCGGWLDVDMNVHGETTEPVENIRWVNGHALTGKYKFYVHNYTKRNNGQTPYKVELEINGKIYSHEGVSTASKDQTTVFEFDYRKGEQPIQLINNISSNATNWNVEMNSFVPVNAIVESPNNWDNQKGDPKHLFFILDGCKDLSEGKGRGFFPEFLKSELREVRKTLEAYTAQSTIKKADKATACGLGFNLATDWNLILRVNGNRLIKIDRFD